MRIDFVGDVITQPFSVLSKALGLVSVSVGHYPIDQHFQVLMSGSLSDILVCHARAEFFIGNGSGGDPLAKMHDYCAAVEQVAATRKTVIVLNTLLPQPNRLVGVHHLSYLRQVAQLNQAIFDLAHRQSLVTIADLAGVLARAGTDQALNVQNDMTMRMPYKRHVLPYLVAEYARAIRERFAPRKKVLLLDADNTLWGGIVGEDGVDGLAIDGQYPGSVYRQFQEQLVGLGESGVLLALVTKNNENDAREAFERLAMPLRWDSFSAVRANWFPKSENIASIAWELNVGLDSMVFIDDNLFEIEEVRNAHPMIDCYHFDGRNAREALQLLYTITDLGIWAPTAEDSGKRAQYAQERERQELHTSAASIDDYIKSLGIRIEAGINRTAHIARIAQLTNKTNQFNLTTRRYSEADIRAAMETGQVFDFRVVDRFGDMGIVGVAVVQNDEIEAFLMSCRALGRRVESAMLDFVLTKATGTHTIAASYIPTPKNAMVESFFDSNGFDLVSSEADTKRYARARAATKGMHDNLIGVI